LGAYIDQGSPVLSPLVALNPYGTQPIMIGVPGHNGNAMHFRQMVGQLGHDYPVYAFQHPRYDARVPKFPTLEALAAHYIRCIEQTIPTDRFFLAGASVGGKIAFEMAQQLMAAGKSPLGVILLDTGLKMEDDDETEPVEQASESLLQTARKTVYRLRRDVIKQVKATDKQRANMRVRSETSRLSRSYQMKPYAGKMFYLSARMAGKDENAEASLAAWQSHACGYFEVIDAVGDHHEMMLEPHVAETARIIRHILSSTLHMTTVRLFLSLRENYQSFRTSVFRNNIRKIALIVSLERNIQN